MVKSREAFTEENQKEESPVHTAVKTAVGDGDVDQENEDPDAPACADIVKQGPANQRPSPLVMGGAEKRGLPFASIAEV